MRGRIDPLGFCPGRDFLSPERFCGSTFELIFPLSDEITKVEGTSAGLDTFLSGAGDCVCFSAFPVVADVLSEPLSAVGELTFIAEDLV